MINEGSQQIKKNALQLIRGAIKKKKKKNSGKNLTQAQKKLLWSVKNAKSCLQLIRFIMTVLQDIRTVRDS